MAIDNNSEPLNSLVSAMLQATLVVPLSAAPVRG